MYYLGDVNMFKIGDKVRRVRPWDHDGFMKQGNIYTITAISSNGIEVEGSPKEWLPRCFELVESAKVPHEHAEVIKAWADGAKIQVRPKPAGKYIPAWLDIPDGEPMFWYSECEYRVKPEPKPDVVRYARASFTEYDPNFPAGNALKTETYWTIHKSGSDNIKVTFDGETGRPKAVELI